MSFDENHESAVLCVPWRLERRERRYRGKAEALQHCLLALLDTTTPSEIRYAAVGGLVYVRGPLRSFLQCGALRAVVG